jgi:hypothetical protein
MLIFPKTDIEADCHFHPSNYPALKESLAVMDERLANLPILHKADMLIASLKGHEMNEEWANANPAVAALIRSHSLPVQELATLFLRSRNADLFAAELETYVRNWFAVTTTIY